jgi:hypothetical protein
MDEPAQWSPYNGPVYPAIGWRNGREAGAYAAGVAQGRAGERMHILIEPHHVDGAATSLVHAGATVRPYSTKDDSGLVEVEVWYNE